MGTYNRKYKGTRTGLTPGPVDKEGQQVTEDAMRGLEARIAKGDNSQNTTRTLPDGMGKDGKAALKEWLKSKE